MLLRAAIWMVGILLSTQQLPVHNLMADELGDGRRSLSEIEEHSSNSNSHAELNKRQRKALAPIIKN